MDELIEIVFSACVSVLVIELLSGLFPDKSESFVRGIAVLTVCAALLLNIFRLDTPAFDFTVQEFSLDSSETELREDTALYGIELLKHRLYTVMDTAGVSVAEKEEGISVQYRTDESGVPDISLVRVRVNFETDIDRAHAVLRGVLTEMIPVEVYTE